MDRLRKRLKLIRTVDEHIPRAARSSSLFFETTFLFSDRLVDVIQTFKPDGQWWHFEGSIYFTHEDDLIRFKLMV